MTKKIFSVIVGTFLIVIAYKFDVFFKVHEKNLQMDQERSAGDYKTISASVVLTELSNEKVIISSNGILEVRRVSNVEAKVSGYVDEMSEDLSVGYEVSKGELLLKIDDLDYQLQLSEAEARMAESRLNLSTEQAEYQQAHTIYRILDQDSEVPLLARRKYQLEKAELDFASRQMAIRQAKRNLANTRVTAQFEGIVLGTYVGKGEWVDVGEPMLELIDTSKIEIKLPLTASQLRLLAKGNTLSGMPAKITFDAHSKRVYAGSIERLIPQIDTKTGSTNLIVALNDPKAVLAGGIPLGAFAEVTFTAKDVSDSQWIPQSALLPTQAIWCITKNNQLAKVSVEVVQYKDNEVLIRLAENSSLPAYIVVRPRAGWMEGEDVKPVLWNVQ